MFSTAMFRPLCRLTTACALALLGMSAWSEEKPDFSGMSDVDVLVYMTQEDREAGLAEFRRRSVGYSREKIVSIEKAYYQRLMTPASKPEIRVEDLFSRINATTDDVVQYKAFLKLQEIYEAADAAEQARIRSAYLAAWDEARQRDFHRENQIEDIHRESRFTAYAGGLGPYVNDEAELIALLQARCIESGIHRGGRLFLNALVRVRFPIGELAAAKAESFYNQVHSGNWEGFESCDLAYLEADIHLIFARCGTPGIASMLRLGTATTSMGLDAIGMMKTEVSNAFLWEVYGEIPESDQKARVKVLLGLLRFNADNADMGARRALIREEVTQLLAIPSGEYSRRAMMDVLSLVARTKDPYYLSHVEALDHWLSAAPPELNTDYYHDAEQEAMSRNGIDVTLEQCRTKLANAGPLD